MTGDEAHAVTGLLRAWGAGDAAAPDALVPLVYEELRRQARRALRREGTGHTLQPTALVHEAWLRLADQHDARWESRSQFLAVAAQMMRRVLVDHARTRRALKRGGGGAAVTLGHAAAWRNRSTAASWTLQISDEIDGALRPMALAWLGVAFDLQHAIDTDDGGAGE